VRPSNSNNFLNNYKIPEHAFPYIQIVANRTIDHFIVGIFTVALVPMASSLLQRLVVVCEQYENLGNDTCRLLSYLELCVEVDATFAVETNVPEETALYIL
jgi:hypothetical protein